MKYLKLYEDYNIDPKLLKNLDPGGTTTIPAVRSIKGDLDKAIYFLSIIPDRKRVAEYYKALIDENPEWMMTQDIIDNREKEEEAKIIELALLIQDPDK